MPGDTVHTSRDERHMVSQPAVAVNRVQGDVSHHGCVPHMGIFLDSPSDSTPLRQQCCCT